MLLKKTSKLFIHPSSDLYFKGDMPGLFPNKSPRDNKSTFSETLNGFHRHHQYSTCTCYTYLHTAAVTLFERELLNCGTCNKYLALKSPCLLY